jgi:acyl-CoA synthetase (NDP forming)
VLPARHTPPDAQPTERTAAVGAPATDRAAIQPLVTPDRLRSFFAARSVALVGASDTSGWARNIVLSSQISGFTGPLIPVHPGHPTAFGQPTVPTLRELAEPVDLAFVLAPTHAVAGVLDDAAAAGIHHAVVLAAGYREVGGAGRELQDELVAQAVRNDITLLGPNCLGYLNAHTASAPFALTVPPPLIPGPVGLVLQSGALATAVLDFARAHAVGVSLLASMGNESVISTVDVVNYLIQDGDTKVICLFLEEIGQPSEFAAAARVASEAGKPIVVLKVGASPAGRAAALAHTGSVAGDDAVVDAVLRQLNVIRVASLEELLTTAALLGYNRHPAGRRMAVLTASGGACDIIADLAADAGLAIPPFAPDTAAAIGSHLPPFASASNPLDVTGYLLANERTGALLSIDHALDAALADPGIDLVLFASIMVPPARPPDEQQAKLAEERVAWLAERLAAAPIPVIPVSTTCVDLGPYARDLLTPHGINVLGGIDLAVRALGKALWWIENAAAARSWPVPVPPAARTGPALPWSELAARELLASAGVPLVPAELVDSADAAVAAARRLGLPVALKICAAGIPHKSDVGGVALGLDSDDAVRAAYERVRAGSGGAGVAVEGVLVSPMRTGGVELLAGVSVDPTFGPVLAVGLGGLWVEILRDTSLRALPVDAAEVRRMLGSLRGFELLRGARGGRPADLDRLASAIVALTGAAAGLGDRLRALEVNPLWVNGDRVEALDALVVT